MTEWRRDGLETALSGQGWLVGSREIEHAVQLELREGVKVNLYNTGTLTVVGPKSDFKTTVEAFVKAAPAAAGAEKQEPSMGHENTQPVNEADVID